LPEGISIHTAFAGGVLTLILLLVVVASLVYGLNETFGLVSYTLGWVISGHGYKVLEVFRFNGSTVWSVWMAFILYKIFKYLFLKHVNEIAAIIVFLIIFLPVTFILWNFIGWAMMDLAEQNFGVDKAKTGAFQRTWDDYMYVFETAVVGLSLMMMTWEGMTLFWKYDVRPKYVEQRYN